MADRWTPDEDALLRDIYLNNSKETILSRLNKGWRTICRRARRLDLHRDVLLVNEDKKIRGPRKDTYTEPELELIRQIYAHNRKEYILARFSEAGYDRSWQSIRLNAKNMGIHRDPEIVKQEMIELGTIGSTQNRDDLWTEEENALLKEIYPHGRQQDIVDKFPKRNWKSIREHCIRLGLSRDNLVINQDKAQHLMENHGVTSTFQLPGVKEASRQTNLERRGVEYPTQCPEVREKIRETVQEKYKVDNIFQAEEIKNQIKKTNLDRYGVENPNQSPEIRAKITETNQERYGVSNPFQMVDRVQDGMMRKYGYDSPFKVPEIHEKIIKTNVERYGFAVPSQNPAIHEKIMQTSIENHGGIYHTKCQDIKEKIIETNLKRYGVDNPAKAEEIKTKIRATTLERFGVESLLQLREIRDKGFEVLKKRGFIVSSKGEINLLEYLKLFDPNTCHNIEHPEIHNKMDYYLPLFDLWGQYDGDYWHGKIIRKNLNNKKALKIKKTMKRDEFQNKNIPNLIRFWESDVLKAIKNHTIMDLIETKIQEKIIKSIPA